MLLVATRGHSTYLHAHALHLSMALMAPAKAAVISYWLLLLLVRR